MLQTSVHVLAFDIGIRNLAWCLMKKDGTTSTVLGWDNYDLLSENSTQDAKNNEKVICNNCKKRAQYIKLSLIHI